MNKGAILGFLFSCLLAGLMLVTTPALAVSPNLLTNPGAETNDLSGWTIIANGGNGWGVTTSTPYQGTYRFMTSYDWDKRSQEIDLLAKGYTAAQLDAASTVSASEWFGEMWKGDDYYLKVELRDVNHNVITSWYSGILNTGGVANDPSDDAWYQLEHTFSGYGPGLRYIYWEDGSKDTEGWAGWYGAKLDAAYLSINIDTLVGVEVYPLNKLALLAPWLALASILVLVIGGSILAVRRRRAN